MANHVCIYLHLGGFGVDYNVWHRIWVMAHIWIVVNVCLSFFPHVVTRVALLFARELFHVILQRDSHLRGASGGSWWREQCWRLLGTEDVTSQTTGLKKALKNLTPGMRHQMRSCKLGVFLACFGHIVVQYFTPDSPFGSIWHFDCVLQHKTGWLVCTIVVAGFAIFSW